MRTTDIPRFIPQVVTWYEHQLAAHDARVEAFDQAIITDPKSRQQIVGFCKASVLGDEALLLPIYLCDTVFMRKNPQDWNILPLGSIARLDDDAIVIYINSITRTMALDPVMEAIGTGVLAHELGHYSAGHLHKPKSTASQKTSAEINWQVVTQQLLDGSLTGETIELEANLHAIALVGFGPILASIALRSSLNVNLGLRMEFSNQMHHLIDLVCQPDFTPPETKLEDVVFDIYTDEQIDTAFADEDA